MKVTKEISFQDFEFWGSGTQEFANFIIDSGKADAFEEYIEETYPMGVDQTTLNDIVRFDQENVCDMLDLDFEEFENR